MVLTRMYHKLWDVCIYGELFGAWRILFAPSVQCFCNFWVELVGPGNFEGVVLIHQGNRPNGQDKATD